MKKSMKTIWIVISGSDFEDCQNVEGCFESLTSAEEKISSLKNPLPGHWLEERPNFWSKGDNYLRIQMCDLLP